jgi:hypothetical protein
VAFGVELEKKVWPPAVNLPQAPARVPAGADDMRSVIKAKGCGATVEGQPSTKAPARAQVATEAKGCGATVDGEPSTTASVADRLEALRARVCAKHAARLSETVGPKAEASRELAVCEDAIALHAIVTRLFEKNEQRNKSSFDSALLLTGAMKQSPQAIQATTSEAEVIAVVNSQRSMNTARLQAALAFLRERCVDWFTTKEGVFNVGARYLHRLPNASSNHAMRMLQEKRKQLQERMATS